MLQVHDIRESRVYKEAHQEGRQEGRQEERKRTISKLAASQMTPDAIAAMLGLDIDLVRKELEKNPTCE